MTDRPDLHVVGTSPDASADWATREDWLDAGRRLGERSERDRWALGDWACHGERAYGDLVDAAALIGLGYQTVRNLASVARKIELSRRRDNLSWSHHAAVAALPTEIGDDLLDRAAAEGWSRETMREEAQAASREVQLKAENAALRRRAAAAETDARDEDRRGRRRVAAAGKDVTASSRELLRVVESVAASPALEGLHGHARAGLARDLSGRIAKASQAFHKARAEASAHVSRIERGDEDEDPTLAVTALLADLGPMLALAAAWIDRAGVGEQAPEARRALAARFEAAIEEAMAAAAPILEGDVRAALDRLADAG